MALPNTFAAVTSATGAQLDANFNAVGKIGAIPCAVSGTNALTLTPTAGITPTIAAYANYLQFSGIVVTTNTSAVTVQAGSLTALNGYKDSAAGPVALSGGELIAGNAFTAIYDSALNAGIGGFHIYTNTGFAGGTITGNVVLSGSTLSVLGGAFGASLTSTLLTGNSLSIVALSASLSALRIGGASAATIDHVFSTLSTLTFTLTPANSVQDQNIAMANVQVRDCITLGFGPSVPSGAGFMGFCGTLGTVTVRLLNPTAASISLTTLTVRATAMGFA